MPFQSPPWYLPSDARLDVEVVVHVAVGEAVDDELVDDLVAPVLHVRRERGLLAVGGNRTHPDSGATAAPTARSERGRRSETRVHRMTDPHG